MIWMLLGISVGWTVTPNSRHPIRDRKELTINLTVTIIHVRRTMSLVYSFHFCSYENSSKTTENRIPQTVVDLGSIQFNIIAAEVNTILCEFHR